MNKVIRKLSKRNKAIIVIYLLTMIAYIVSFSFFTNSLLSLANIETILRYTVLVLFFLYFIFYFIISLARIMERKYGKFIRLTILSFIFIIIFSISSYFINYIYNGLNNLGESESVTHTSYLITLTDEEFDEDDVIGIIDSSVDEEDNDLAKKLLEEEKLNNKIESYNDYIKLIDKLYEGEVGAIIVPSNFVSLFGTEEGFENLTNDTEIVFQYSETIKNADASIVSNKGFDEPLTFLIMGVDSETDGLDASAAFNGDTLMLVTFNPNTLNATMFSIPRDTLVPIACNNNQYAKINSSAAYGTQCVIDTVENLTDIEIDYYVKINFKGVVDLVDAIGGIEVDVEEPDFDTYDGQVCEQNSDREFGSSLICMDPGLQTLNGEQALAYSRNRSLYLLSDMDRNRHQQQVVTGIANKLLEFTSVDDFNMIYETVQDNFITNMSVDQMFSAYDVMKDVLSSALSGNEFINIEKSYLEVYNLRVWLPSSGRESASLGYYEDSLNDIVDMMKVNLELEEREVVKTFSFSVNEPYEAYVAGQGELSGKTTDVLPNFIGLSQSEAESFCNKNNVNCTFNIVDSENENYNSGIASDKIGYQSVHENTLLNTISKVTFYVNGEIISQNNSTTDDSDTNDSDDSNDEEPVDSDVTDIMGE